MNDIDSFSNILVACKHFFCYKYFLQFRERKSILLNQFVNRPTTVRLNIHVISCDTYDIIYNHWASLLLSCILHKVWATGLTHCYFFRYFLHGKNQERERKCKQFLFYVAHMTWNECRKKTSTWISFFFST